MPVHHIPEGYNSITPYLVIKGAAEAIEYYKNVFGRTWSSRERPKRSNITRTFSEPPKSCAWLNRTAASATRN